MSNSNPSWLTEEVVSAAAKNPHVQKAAINAGKAVAADAAKNPEPYMAQAFNNNNSKGAAGNEPAWAKAAASSYVPPLPAGGPPSFSSSYNSNAGNLEAGRMPTVSEPGADLTETELKEIKRAHMILRFLYIGVSVCMAAAAVLTLGGASVQVFFIAGYVFFFSILMCCFETGFSFIAKGISVNFGFMYSTFGRVVFNLFVAVMCFSMDTLFGTIDMALLVGILAIHLYVMFRYPKYSEYVRRTHYFAAKNAV